MRVVSILLAIVHWFVGLGALVGGSAAVLDPVHPLGISTEVLRNGPFTDFLIPGLFLAFVLGLGNLVVGVLVYRHGRWHELTSGLWGCFLVGWIVVQCWVLWAVTALHVVYFALGVLQGLLALVLLVSHRAFPLATARRRPGAWRQPRRTPPRR